MNTVPFMPPIHPGEVLMKEYLEPLGVTQHKLALAIGVPPRRINEIVHGKRRISADTALRLARYFETTERFWLNLQGRYDLEVERDRLAPELRTSHRSPASDCGPSRSARLAQGTFNGRQPGRREVGFCVRRVGGLCSDHGQLGGGTSPPELTLSGASGVGVAVGRASRRAVMGPGSKDPGCSWWDSRAERERRGRGT